MQFKQSKSDNKWLIYRCVSVTTVKNGVTRMTLPWQHHDVSGRIKIYIFGKGKCCIIYLPNFINFGDSANFDVNGTDLP